MESNYSANIKVTNAFRQLTKEMGISAAGMTIALLLGQGEHVIPIPGTLSVDHLNQLIEGARELTAEELKVIDRILPLGWPHGDRYSRAQWEGPVGYC